MPARYEAMRDRFKKEGMADDAAKGKAARIFNGTRKKGEQPVTRSNSEVRANSGLRKAFPKD